MRTRDVSHHSLLRKTVTEPLLGQHNQPEPPVAADDDDQEWVVECRAVRWLPTTWHRMRLQRYPRCQTIGTIYEGSVFDLQIRYSLGTPGWILS